MDLLQMMAAVSYSAPDSSATFGVPPAVLQQSVSALKKITADTNAYNATDVVSKVDLMKLVTNFQSSVKGMSSEIKNAILLDSYK